MRETIKPNIAFSFGFAAFLCISVFLTGLILRDWTVFGAAVLAIVSIAITCIVHAIISRENFHDYSKADFAKLALPAPFLCIAIALIR
jgi:hypothetical protein